MSFIHVDRYIGIRLGLDLSEVTSGKLQVVESHRRLTAEQSYGFIHGLWWIWLADDRRVVSVPPGASEAVQATLKDLCCEQSIFDDGLAEVLKGSVDTALVRAGLPATDRMFRDFVFACDRERIRSHPLRYCRRLVDESIPTADGLRLPSHCFPDGVVYGVVCEGRVVSVAFAHRTGVLEDVVADVGVETAPGYRRRGYAQTVVSALVRHFTEGGGESRYSCSPNNEASIATAQSVGFVPYGKSLILSSPRLDAAKQ